MSNKQDKLKKLIDMVIKQGDHFYNIIQKQYPSQDWKDLTEAEQNMLFWFNDFEMKHIQEFLEADKKDLN